MAVPGRIGRATRFAQIQEMLLTHEIAFTIAGDAATGCAEGVWSNWEHRRHGGTTGGTAKLPQDAQHAGRASRTSSMDRDMAATPGARSSGDLREAELATYNSRPRARRRVAREQVSQAAARGAAAGSNQGQQRPTPEELGYYTTDDSFTKIIDDAAGQFSERVRKSDAKKQFSRRLSDLFGRDE